MADSRANVPTFAPMTPSNTLIQKFTYAFVTIVAALALRRLIIFVWYCASSLGDWIIGNFENNRIDDLSLLSSMATREENPDNVSCEGPHVEAGNTSETLGVMDNKGRQYDQDVKNYEDSMKRIIEGKDKEEDVRTMRNSIADYAVTDEIDMRFREKLEEENQEFNENIEGIRRQTRSIEGLAEQYNQELRCRKLLLPQLDDD
ncbi:unnamed protein product [Caenorhabditis brenneri]